MHKRGKSEASGTNREGRQAGHETDTEGAMERNQAGRGDGRKLGGEGAKEKRRMEKERRGGVK